MKQEFEISFVKGIIGDDSLLNHHEPHICFVGRSNVGKSSTINMIFNRTVAKSSARPGKTTELNIFRVNHTYYVVDLPGYGYARMSGKEAEKMRKRIVWYLTESKAPIKKFVLILDVKAGVTDYDKELLSIAYHERIDSLILINKTDKLNQKENYKAHEEIKKVLNTMFPENSIVILPISARTKKGRDMVIKELFCK